MAESYFKKVEVAQQKSHNGNVFPAVLNPKTVITDNDSVSSLTEAIKVHKPWLESLLHKSGAILFRGFPVTSPSDFNDVVEAFGFPEMPYIGGRATRTNVFGRVYTANESPPDQKIPYHQEMCNVAVFPSKIFFFCEVAPGGGGETPIVLGHIIYELMKVRHPEFVSQLEEHGLIYTIMLGGKDDPSSSVGRCWQSVFGTNDKGVAEKRAAELGSKLEWIEDGVKMIVGPLPGIRFDAKKKQIEIERIIPENIFEEVQLPEFQHKVNGVVFPAVLFPNAHNNDSLNQLSRLTEAIEAYKPWLESLLNKNGAILFRGFPATSPCHFNAVVEAFDYPEMPYIGGGGLRTQVIGRVSTANESPPDQRIHFHNGMAYASEFPTKVFFFCEVEPGSGGETAIVPGHVIYDRMKQKHPEFVKQQEEHGLIYTRHKPDEDDPLSSLTGRGWKSTFSMDSKIICEQRAAKMGMKLQWMEKGVYIKTYPKPAIKFDEVSQRKTWFNNLAVAYVTGGDAKHYDPDKSVTFGDGRTLPADAVLECLKIMDEECVAIPWRKGDILLVDNLTVLHSRLPLFSPPRRILASLCK